MLRKESSRRKMRKVDLKINLVKKREGNDYMSIGYELHI